MSFTKLERDDEIMLLQNDDSSFHETKRYVLPLIDSALDRFDLSVKEREKIKQSLVNIIPLAVGRYLKGLPSNKGGSFAVYYAWYIHQEMEKHEAEQKA